MVSPLVTKLVRPSLHALLWLGEWHWGRWIILDALHAVLKALYGLRSPRTTWILPACVSARMWPSYWGKRGDILQVLLQAGIDFPFLSGGLGVAENVSLVGSSRILLVGSFNLLVHHCLFLLQGILSGLDRLICLTDKRELITHV